MQHALRQSQPRGRRAVPLQPQHVCLRLRPADVAIWSTLGAVWKAPGYRRSHVKSFYYSTAAPIAPIPLASQLLQASEQKGGCTLASSSVAGGVGSEGMCASGGASPSGAATSMGSPADASRSFSSAMKRVRCGSTCGSAHNVSAASSSQGVRHSQRRN